MMGEPPLRRAIIQVSIAGRTVSLDVRLIYFARFVLVFLFFAPVKSGDDSFDESRRKQGFSWDKKRG